MTESTGDAAPPPTGDLDEGGTAPPYGDTVLALLRLVVGKRLPEGPLGPETVPASLLALPVDLAIEELVRHAKSCKRNPCPHAPRRLRVYAHMRPRAFRGAQDDVHRVLWEEPEHPLVDGVRAAIRERHPDLSLDVAKDNLLGPRLEEVLTELGPGGSQILAAVLWATRFEGPDAEMVFRILAAMCEEETATESETETPEDSEGSLRAKLGSLKASLKTLRKELREAKRADKQARTTIRLKEQALGRARTEAEEARGRHEASQEVAAKLEEENRNLTRAVKRLEDDGESSARVRERLRKEIKQLQSTRRNLEVRRSELAGELAKTRRRVEQLELQMGMQPTGADAMWEFLQERTDQIQTERRIAQGGAKARADDDWKVHRKLERAFLDAFPDYRQASPVAIRPKVPTRLVTLGGSGEVGRSCYLLELGDHRILVDCGITPGTAVTSHPEIDDLPAPDALILTHAHTDHVGWVPALVHRFPELDIYCSRGTAALLPVILDDCHRHYLQQLTLHNERAQYVTNARPIDEEYIEEDIELVSNLVVECSFGEPEPLPFGGITLEFYRAGHVLGASSVLVKDESGRSVFFSGDFSSFPQLTLSEAQWPEELGEVDLLVLESTYGDRPSHPPMEESRRQLVSFLRETIESRGGSVILASFALGRAQELLRLIANAQAIGELPMSVPVHYDGMIRRINPIYQKLAGLTLPNEFNEVSGQMEREEIAFHAAMNPTLIVTTSGMLNGGPVVEYASRLLPDSRHRIVLTGYQDEGAPSRALRDLTNSGASSSRVVIVGDESGEDKKFTAANPAKEIGLSAHADQKGLLEYAARLRPRCIALVHGEPNAQEVLRSRLREMHPKAQVSCGPLELPIP